jgi:hypothetical protein
MSFAAIVASLHGRTGKTLLARVLAEYFILSGRRPLLFDTDAVECRLCACFPHEAMVVDLNRVPDQMTLFDTMAVAAPEARVVDVSHQSYRKFFRVMQDIDFIAETRAFDVEPIIFYLADRNADSYDEALRLRDRFPDSAMVTVENAFVGPPGESVRRSGPYQAFVTHALHMTIPVLEPAARVALAEPEFSVSDFMRRPVTMSAVPLSPQSGPTRDAHGSLRAWVMRMFRDIHRVSRAVTARTETAIAANS